MGRRDEADHAAINRRLLWWGLLVGVIVAAGWLLERRCLRPALRPTSRGPPSDRRGSTYRRRDGAGRGPGLGARRDHDGADGFPGLWSPRPGRAWPPVRVVFALTEINGWGLAGVWWGMAAMILARLLVLAVLVRRLPTRAARPRAGAVDL